MLEVTKYKVKYKDLDISEIAKRVTVFFDVYSPYYSARLEMLDSRGIEMATGDIVSVYVESSAVGKLEARTAEIEFVVLQSGKENSDGLRTRVYSVELISSLAIRDHSKTISADFSSKNAAEAVREIIAETGYNVIAAVDSDEPISFKKISSPVDLANRILFSARFAGIRDALLIPTVKPMTMKLSSVSRMLGDNTGLKIKKALMTSGEDPAAKYMSYIAMDTAFSDSSANIVSGVTTDRSTMTFDLLSKKSVVEEENWNSRTGRTNDAVNVRRYDTVYASSTAASSEQNSRTSASTNFMDRLSVIMDNHSLRHFLTMHGHLFWLTDVFGKAVNFELTKQDIDNTAIGNKGGDFILTSAALTIERNTKSFINIELSRGHKQ